MRGFRQATTMRKVWQPTLDETTLFVFPAEPGTEPAKRGAQCHWARFFHEVTPDAGGVFSVPEALRRHMRRPYGIPD